jgi:hypothetical protein
MCGSKSTESWVSLLLSDSVVFSGYVGEWIQRRTAWGVQGGSKSRRLSTKWVATPETTMAVSGVVACRM